MGDAALEHAAEPLIQLANRAGRSSETSRGKRTCVQSLKSSEVKNMRAIAKFAPALPPAAYFVSV